MTKNGERLELWRRILASSRVLMTLSVLSMVLGVAFSVHFRNFEWLSRFGALVICWGILLLARPSFTGIEVGEPVYADNSVHHLDDPRYYEERGEEVPDFAIDRAASRFSTGVLGPVVCFAGTLTNGFASLLNVPCGFLP